MDEKKINYIQRHLSKTVYSSQKDRDVFMRMETGNISTRRALAEVAGHNKWDITRITESDFLEWVRSLGYGV